MWHANPPFARMFAVVNSFRTHVDRDLGRFQLRSVHDLCLHPRFRCSCTQPIVAMSQKQLPRREIGNTGIKASVLSFGASPLGSVFEVSLDAHASAVRKPVRHADLGLPLLDVIREGTRYASAHQQHGQLRASGRLCDIFQAGCPGSGFLYSIWTRWLDADRQHRIGGLKDCHGVSSHTCGNGHTIRAPFSSASHQSGRGHARWMSWHMDDTQLKSQKHASQDIDEEEGVRAVHEAFRLGINYFDTSPFYGSTRSEQVSPCGGMAGTAKPSRRRCRLRLPSSQSSSSSSSEGAEYINDTW
jgi:Aldo/keto reductase family